MPVRDMSLFQRPQHHFSAAPRIAIRDDKILVRTELLRAIVQRDTLILFECRCPFSPFIGTIQVCLPCNRVVKGPHMQQSVLYWREILKQSGICFGCWRCICWVSRYLFNDNSSSKFRASMACMPGHKEPPGVSIAWTFRSKEGIAEASSCS